MSDELDAYKLAISLIGNDDRLLCYCDEDIETCDPQAVQCSKHAFLPPRVCPRHCSGLIGSQCRVYRAHELSAMSRKGPHARPAVLKIAVPVHIHG